MDRGPVNDGPGKRKGIDPRSRATPTLPDARQDGAPRGPSRSADGATESRPRQPARPEHPRSSASTERPRERPAPQPRDDGPEEARQPARAAQRVQPRRQNMQKPVPVAPSRAAAQEEAPPEPRGATRPRRLPTSEGRSADAVAAEAPRGADRDAGEALQPEPAERRNDRMERRRELSRSLKGRRSALPPPRQTSDADAAPADAGEDERTAHQRERASEDDGAQTASAQRSARRRSAFLAPPEVRPGRSLVDEPDSDAIVENGPIVAPDTVSGRSLTAVVAIMTFLCALLLGSAIIVDRAASAWSASVLDDVSVTVLPLDGDPLARRLEAAAERMRAAPGLSDVEIVTARQSEALLEPWLGTGADLSLLPVPRLVTARREEGFDASALATALQEVPGATLDDHSAWSDRLAAMAGGVTGATLLALALMLGATVISIVFATRATIASNATTVEVLHVLGAEDGFIARAFRGRFLRIGLRGAAAGLAGALILFGALEAWSMLSAGAASRQAEALLGAPRIGPFGFAGLVVLALAVAGLVTTTASFAVRYHLKELNR